MYLLYRNAPSNAAERFMDIMRSLGGSSGAIESLEGYGGIVRERGGARGGIVLDCDSLCDQSTQDDVDSVLTWCRTNSVNVLLLVTGDSSSCTEFVRMCTQGAVVALHRLERATRVTFPRSAEYWSRELAGQVYDRPASDALALHIGGTARPEVIAEVNGEASFLRLPLGSVGLHVWSTLGVFDVRRRLAAESEFEQAIETYVPAIMFARLSLGDRCFVNPTPRAGLVIDDPLLRPRYGFIDFRELLASARRNAYHVTLAFIPWNGWRSTRRKAALFKEYADCFSLCVHGCDHTHHEYGVNLYDIALQKNRIAAERMKRHQLRTEVGYEPLFVCPQEQCSAEAWKALANSGHFLAMINTGCMPRNLSEPTLTGADLLAPAQDAFFGFPVFKRHYWTDMSVFAMALFLGKPAILVEHHEFFRDRCSRIETFARDLVAMNERIGWGSLLDTVVTTHWRRSTGSGESELRFFASRFRFSHDREEKHLYRLVKRIGTVSNVRGVTVNRQAVEYRISDEWMAFEVVVNEPGIVEVAIDYAQPPSHGDRRFGWKYQAGVAVRRGLSEWRDNVLTRNPYVLHAGRRVMQTLRLTGTAQTRRG